MTAPAFTMVKSQQRHRTIIRVECKGRRFEVAMWPVMDVDESMPNPTVHFGHVVTQPQGEYIGTVAGRRMGDWTFTPSDRELPAVHANLRTVIRVGLSHYLGKLEGDEG